MQGWRFYQGMAVPVARLGAETVQGGTVQCEGCSCHRLEKGVTRSFERLWRESLRGGRAIPAHSRHPYSDKEPHQPSGWPTAPYSYITQRYATWLGATRGAVRRDPRSRVRSALPSPLFPRSSRDAAAQSSAREEERSRPAARSPSLSAPQPFDGRAHDPRERRAPGERTGPRARAERRSPRRDRQGLSVQQRHRGTALDLSTPRGTGIPSARRARGADIKQCTDRAPRRHCRGAPWGSGGRSAPRAEPGGSREGRTEARPRGGTVPGRPPSPRGRCAPLLGPCPQRGSHRGPRSLRSAHWSGVLPLVANETARPAGRRAVGGCHVCLTCAAIRRRSALGKGRGGFRLD